MVDKNGAPVDLPEIGLKTRDFPLEIGKEWTVSQNLFSPGYTRVIPYDNTFKVEGYGEVKTKAGTFKAFNPEAGRGESRRQTPADA